MMRETRSPGAWRNIRTRQSTASFHRPFTLNRETGELPAGSYDIEIDEEVIEVGGRTAYRETAIYFYVQNAASTRTIVITPAELELSLSLDQEEGSDVASAAAR